MERENADGKSIVLFEQRKNSQAAIKHVCLLQQMNNMASQGGCRSSWSQSVKIELHHIYCHEHSQSAGAYRILNAGVPSKQVFFLKQLYHQGLVYGKLIGIELKNVMKAGHYSYQPT